jgi:CheY-like chemotaxis protein
MNGLHVPLPLDETGRAADPGTIHLLVIEDHPQVRELVIETLTTAGYQVTPATSGDEAVALAPSLAPVHGTLTDIHMPGAPIQDCLAILHTRWPAMAVGYMSGSALSPQRPEYGPLLGKPFTSAALLAFVADLLPPGPEEATPT